MFSTVCTLFYIRILCYFLCPKSLNRSHLWQILAFLTDSMFLEYNNSLDSYLASATMTWAPPTGKLFLFVLFNLMLRKNYRKFDSRPDISDKTWVVLRNSYAVFPYNARAAEPLIRIQIFFHRIIHKCLATNDVNFK
jgi:hypothetical protein